MKKIHSNILLLLMIMMIERTDRHISRIMAIVGSDQILSVFSAHNLPYQRERAAFIITEFK